MFGCSVFLGSQSIQEIENYLNVMKNAGFSGVFTSLHIPEDNYNQIMEQFIRLTNLVQKLDMTLTVDISKQIFDQIEKDPTLNAYELLKNVAMLRLDYGFSIEEICQLSRNFKIALNASTITECDLIEFHEKGMEFNHIELWHNYYPRPETGLSEKFFVEKNHLFKRWNLPTMAFVPGDLNKRPPIFEGLPTIESMRYASPFESAMKLTQVFCCDKVFVGDPGISERTLRKFRKFIHNQTILLECKNLSHQVSLIPPLHTNRMDTAEHVIRSQESRGYVQSKQIEIVPQALNPRNKGVITIDNQEYGRYMGELQICKSDLPRDPKVNVIGKVVDSDLGLIELIGPGQKFEFEWSE